MVDVLIYDTLVIIVARNQREGHYSPLTTRQEYHTTDDTWVGGKISLPYLYQIYSFSAVSTRQLDSTSGSEAEQFVDECSRHHQSKNC